MVRFGRTITIRHFTNIAYDQNDQVNLGNSTYADTETHAILIFPTPAKFPRGAGRPGMGYRLQMLAEGSLTRNDYGAFVKSSETIEADDHVLFDGGTYRVTIMRPSIPDVGITILVLKKLVGGVS